MLFLKLFLIFTKIGTFNFGGGYAMLSLIHNETVVNFFKQKTAYEIHR